MIFSVRALVGIWKLGSPNIFLTGEAIRFPKNSIIISSLSLSKSWGSVDPPPTRALFSVIFSAIPNSLFHLHWLVTGSKTKLGGWQFFRKALVSLQSTYLRQSKSYGFCPLGFIQYFINSAELVEKSSTLYQDTGNVISLHCPDTQSSNLCLHVASSCFVPHPKYDQMHTTANPRSFADLSPCVPSADLAAYILLPEIDDVEKNRTKSVRYFLLYS